MSGLIKLGISRPPAKQGQELVLSGRTAHRLEFRETEETPASAYREQTFRRDNQSGPPSDQSPPSNEGGMVAIPRWCAIHDRKYVAWYRHISNGRYSHTNTARLTADILRGGFSGDLITQSVTMVGDCVEICPFCGTSGRRSVACTRCGGFVCYGRSDGDYYFRCRSSCGMEGRLVSTTVDIRGVIPRFR